MTQYDIKIQHTEHILPLKDQVLPASLLLSFLAVPHSGRLISSQVIAQYRKQCTRRFVRFAVLHIFSLLSSRPFLISSVCFRRFVFHCFVFTQLKRLYHRCPVGRDTHALYIVFNIMNYFEMCERIVRRVPTRAATKICRIFGFLPDSGKLPCLGVSDNLS